MKKFLGEFKKFITKGNVIDLAVGVVMGTAFGKITGSLVKDVIMPFISLITGSADFTDWKLVIAPAVYDDMGKILTAEVAITYGNFIQAVIDFLIIGFVLFVFVRFFNKMREMADEKDKRIRKQLLEKLKKEGKLPPSMMAEMQAAEAKANGAPPAPIPTKEEILLTEIRDLLKEQAAPKQ